MTRKLPPIDLSICKSDAERLLGRALNEIPDEAWATDWTVEQQGKIPVSEYFGDVTSTQSKLNRIGGATEDWLTLARLCSDTPPRTSCGTQRPLQTKFSRHSMAFLSALIRFVALLIGTRLTRT
jgi:hypothetical protein